MECNRSIHLTTRLSPQEYVNWQILSDPDSLISWINSTSFPHLKIVATFIECLHGHYPFIMQTMPDTEELTGSLIGTPSKCQHRLGTSKTPQSSTQSPGLTSGPRLVNKDAESRYYWKPAHRSQSQTPSTGSTFVGIICHSHSRAEIRTPNGRHVTQCLRVGGWCGVNGNIWGPWSVEHKTHSQHHTLALCNLSPSSVCRNVRTMGCQGWDEGTS